MRYKTCEGYGSKKGSCENETPSNFWLCYYCWTERESDPLYQFSSYTPPELKRLTIKHGE